MEKMKVKTGWWGREHGGGEMMEGGRMIGGKGNYIKEGTSGDGGCVEGGVLPTGAVRAPPAERVIHYHLLRLAEVDVFHVLTPRLAFLNVHDADQRHGPAPEEEDGEEHNDDGGGADQLTLFDGLQAQMEAEGVGDGPTQTCQRTGKEKNQ